MMRFLILFTLTLVPQRGFAHDGAHGPHDILQTWTLEPWVLTLLALSTTAYVLGARALRRRTDSRRVLPRWRLWCFAGAMVALVLALVSPIDALGELLFAGHMVQHLLLTMVAAPLLVLSDAGMLMLWAFSRGGRRAIARGLRTRWVQATWRALTQPVTAWLLHATALVLWHVPWFYELAIIDDRVHSLEHWSFLATALLFWWPVAAPRARHRLGFGTAVVYLFTAATSSAILGAMISMSGEAWYTVHARWTGAWGLTPLEDQQLAGLIMWVPAAIIYLIAVTPLAVRTLSERGATATLAASG